jgi:RNA polymerase sigma factor (sigma-70 family)
MGQVRIMDFETLHKKIAPKLKYIASRLLFTHPACGKYIGKEDLYQEMALHVWSKFQKGVPEGINLSYIVKGCEFHILNYLRKNTPRVFLVSLEKPLNENGDTLKDLIPSGDEPINRMVERKVTIDQIKNNGFTRKEKKVFSFLLDGFTTREVGSRMGISHVMVVKYKKNIIRKWQAKDKLKVTRKQGKLLS